VVRLDTCRLLGYLGCYATVSAHEYCNPFRSHQSSSNATPFWNDISMPTIMSKVLSSCGGKRVPVFKTKSLKPPARAKAAMPL